MKVLTLYECYEGLFDFKQKLLKISQNQIRFGVNVYMTLYQQQICLSGKFGQADFFKSSNVWKWSIVEVAVKRKNAVRKSDVDDKIT